MARVPQSGISGEVGSRCDLPSARDRRLRRLCASVSLLEEPLPQATRSADMGSETHSEPSEVAAEDGVVYVDGPDGVAVALTPEAAIETSHRLLDGGLSAHGQNVLKADEPKQR